MSIDILSLDYNVSYDGLINIYNYIYYYTYEATILSSAFITIGHKNLYESMIKLGPDEDYASEITDNFRIKQKTANYIIDTIKEKKSNLRGRTPRLHL